jgi:cation transport ATPase
MVTNYIHHVPGRLRVRTPLLKGQAQRATQVQKTLAQLHGVRSAEVNPVTGSIKVHYDAGQTTHRPLLDHLRLCGYLSATDQPVPYTPTYKLRWASATSVDRVAKVAGAYLLEKAVERSILLLLAAL